MTTKKNNKIKSGKTPDVLTSKKIESFWEDKTIKELASEQGITPVKDEQDFTSRYIGGGEDWDDIDEFLKYFHSH